MRSRVLSTEDVSFTFSESPPEARAIDGDRSRAFRKTPSARSLRLATAIFGSAPTMAWAVLTATISSHSRYETASFPASTSAHFSPRATQSCGSAPIVIWFGKWAASSPQ